MSHSRPAFQIHLAKRSPSSSESMALSDHDMDQFDSETEGDEDEGHGLSRNRGYHSETLDESDVPALSRSRRSHTTSPSKGIGKAYRNPRARQRDRKSQSSFSDGEALSHRLSVRHRKKALHRAAGGAFVPSGDLDSDDQIRLESFDFDRLNNKNGFYLLLGKRNTGKTTWCRFINQHIQASRDGFVVLITQNERLKENWSHHIPKLFIFQPEDADIMKSIHVCMNNAIKSCERRGIDSQDNRLRLTFILDDVGSENKVMNNLGLKSLAANGRHINVTVFILAQFLYQVPPKVRSQFEFIFMLASISQKSNKIVNNEFAAHVEYPKFCKILQKATEDHGVLIINTTSANVSDSLFFSKIAEYPIPVVRLGCWVQWAMNYFMYSEHENFEDFCGSDLDVQEIRKQDQANRKQGIVETAGKKFMIVDVSSKKP